MSEIAADLQQPCMKHCTQYGVCASEYGDCASLEQATFCCYTFYP